MTSRMEEKIVELSHLWQDILSTDDEDIVLEESKPIFKWLIGFEKLMRRTFGDERFEEIMQSGYDDWDKFMAHFKREESP